MCMCGVCQHTPHTGYSQLIEASSGALSTTGPKDRSAPELMLVVLVESESKLTKKITTTSAIMYCMTLQLIRSISGQQRRR